MTAEATTCLLTIGVRYVLAGGVESLAPPPKPLSWEILRSEADVNVDGRIGGFEEGREAEVAAAATVRDESFAIAGADEEEEEEDSSRLSRLLLLGTRCISFLHIREREREKMTSVFRGHFSMSRALTSFLLALLLYLFMLTSL